MKAIMYWAGKNILYARILLVILAVLQVAIGVNIGFALLHTHLSSQPHILLLALVLIAIGINLIYRARRQQFEKIDTYIMFRTKCLAGLYSLSFLFSMVAGGYIAQYDFNQNNRVPSTLRSIVEPAKNTLFTNTPSVAEGNAPLKKGTFTQRLIQKWKMKMLKRAAEGRYSKKGLIGLFFLGLGTALLSAFVGCALACANTTLASILAVLTVVGGVGAIIAAIYFLALGLKTQEQLNQRTDKQNRTDKKLALALFIFSGLMVIGFVVAFK